MASSPQEVTQREFHVAIIDEQTLFLLMRRERRILSPLPWKDTSKYNRYAQNSRDTWSKNRLCDRRKARTAKFKPMKEYEKIESALHVSKCLWKDFDTLFHIEASLKATTLFKKIKIHSQRGEVIIVDEFTGRLLQGRRFSEGLHQAIEAKENVPIQENPKTLATVSLQNYFRNVQKLAGMTGTAATESEEFHKIYKTDVIVIPTHFARWSAKTIPTWFTNREGKI